MNSSQLPGRHRWGVCLTGYPWFMGNARYPHCRGIPRGQPSHLDPTLPSAAILPGAFKVLAADPYVRQLRAALIQQARPLSELASDGLWE